MFTPLQIILSLASLVFLLFAIDLYQRKKMNLLHFIVFFGGTLLVILFSLDNELLNAFGEFFGLRRGADLLVYAGLILLLYFYFELLNKVTKDDQHLTSLVGALANQAAYEHCGTEIRHYVNTEAKDEFIFFVRAYNEDATIGKVIDDIYQAGFSKILLIDDGSRQSFVRIIQEKKSQYPHKLLIYVQHPVNRGRGGGGASTKTGLAFLKKYGHELGVQRVVGFDADDQMDIADMKIFMRQIDAHPGQYDMLLGSRFVSGSKVVNMPLMRRIVLLGAKLVTYVFNGIWITDSHCGYRVYTLDAAQKMHITSDGMIYANELNDEIKRNKLRFCELPVHIRYTDYSLGKGQKNMNALKILFDLIYKKLFFR